MYTGTQLAYLLVLFLVASFSVFLWIKNGRKQQKFLCIYLGITFSLEFLMYIFQIYFKSSANFGFLYNIYILFCAFFFLKYFNKNQDKSLIILNTSIFSWFVFVYVFYIFKNYREVNQVIGISFALVYIFYSLIWFYSKIKNPSLEKITNEPKFWIASGLLFWGVFFILRIIPRYLFNKIDEEVLIISQSFFFIINIFFYVLFLISLIKYSKNHGSGKYE
ncbi:hypothetical protein SAMN05421664_1174 [Chryseobacterium soldanellicola]|uniref:YhhN-like protein n=1 Tax=Chryseobacterium soldanellicola TaxID=311333 RepID=A0A1H0ZZX3_9FLAO|nr:hypothetical protein SAMN05421664_1174 [Chryseobacterium soldanellicola]